MLSRRELVLAAGLTVAGAVLLLLAAGQPWARVAVTPPPPLPPTVQVVTGRALAPLVASVGLLGLAAVAGLAATRGGWRRVLGVLLLAAGIAAAAAAVSAAAAGADALAARAGVVRSGTLSVARTAWPAVAVVGGALLVVGGAVTAARGGRRPGLGARYDRDSPRPRRADPDRDLWDALDRGEDPTGRDTAR